MVTNIPCSQAKQEGEKKEEKKKGQLFDLSKHGAYEPASREHITTLPHLILRA
jgi:hypothetical protein